MSNTKNKDQSALVHSVTILDGHLSDLARLGAKLEEMELDSDFDFEQAQRHIDLFAQAGEGVSAEIVKLAAALNDARAEAEAWATKVTTQAEKLAARKIAVQGKMEELRALGESVRLLTLALTEIKPASADISPEEKAQLMTRLGEADQQLQPLIERAQVLRKEAQFAKMKTLEKSADALSQSLTAISQKLGHLQPHGLTSH